MNMSSRSNSQFLGASVSEFINIWALGGDASLNLKTSGGLSTVSFNCTLGHPGAPHSPPPPSSSPVSSSKSPSLHPRHRGPAERERNRLRAAQHQAAKEVTTAPVLTSATVANNASVASSPTHDASPEASTEEDKPVSVSEDLTIQFKCDQCSYSNTTDKGLRQHIRMKHRISQLDGIDDSFVKEDVGIQTNGNVKIDYEPVDHEESNIAKQCCPLCGDDVVYLKTESEFKTHILNNHDQMQVLETFGKEWIEENTRHFFFMDKDRRKIWKNFMKRRQ
jgi:hypothetical protein